VEPPPAPIELALLPVPDDPVALPIVVPDPLEPVVLSVPLDEPMVDEPVLLPVPDEPVDPAEAEGPVLLLELGLDEPVLDEADGLELPDAPIELLPVPPLAVPPWLMQGLVPLGEEALPAAPMPRVADPELSVLDAPELLEPVLLPASVLGLELELELGLEVEPDVLPGDVWACTAAEATARAALAARRASLWVVTVMSVVLQG